MVPKGCLVMTRPALNTWNSIIKGSLARVATQSATTSVSTIGSAQAVVTQTIATRRCAFGKVVVVLVLWIRIFVVYKTLGLKPAALSLHPETSSGTVIGMARVVCVAETIGEAEIVLTRCSFSNDDEMIDVLVSSIL